MIIGNQNKIRIIDNSNYVTEKKIPDIYIGYW